MSRYTEAKKRYEAMSVDKAFATLKNLRASFFVSRKRF